MKAIRFLLATFWFGLLAACGGGGDSAPAAGPPAPPDPTADLAVTVADTLGRFVDGAAITVASTGASASTDATGKATLRVPVGSEQVLAIAKGGFAEQVRVVSLDASAIRGEAVALLVPREPAATIPAIESGGSATGRHGVKVEFPAGALVDAGGQPVTGTIDLFMTPLDISTSDVGAFPGLFEGLPTGAARGPIVTLGTAELVPQQGGQKLRLAAGKTATIELPLYATTLFDGTPIQVGTVIPFWSLASTTGLWTQEGAAAVVANAASPTGMALRATISHFSWWNIDQFTQRGNVTLTVTAPGNNVPANTLAQVQAQVVSGTGPTSVVSAGFTVGVAQTVPVPAPSTVRFSTVFQLGNLKCSGDTTVAVAVGATLNATLATTCIELPTPRIIVPSALGATNSSAPTRVQIVVDGAQPDSVDLLVDGSVVKTFGPQFLYVHLLDTAGLPEGTATLEVRATLAGDTQGGNSVQLVIDRTAPAATQILPAPGSLVTRDTTFTVAFDEPVNPLPFGLADAVKLTVTPTGATTPVAVPAVIALDTAGLTLTVDVAPGATLPLGIVGLSWGGLVDAAGNAVTGTVAATYPVDRSDLVGPALDHVSSTINDTLGPALAIAGDGSLVAAHRPAPGDFIRLSRHDPATDTWTQVVAAVNERPTRNLVQMATDGAGVVYIAFVQQTAADPAAFELVLKRLVGNAVELAAPAVALPGSRGSDITAGSMAIDASNRPVLTFTGPSGADVQLLRLEQGTIVSLGPIATLAFDPRLALQADGSILVTYLQGFAGSNAASLRVVRVAANGNVAPVGPPIDGTPDATQGIGQPRVLARGDEPWVFWDKFDGLVRRTHAARFDGTSWIEVPFPAPIEGFEIAVAVLEGDPIAVVSDGSNRAMQVLRFRNGAWEPAFDATPRAGAGDHVQVAIRGGTAMVISSQVNAPIAEVQRLVFP